MFRKSKLFCAAVVAALMYSFILHLLLPVSEPVMSGAGEIKLPVIMYHSVLKDRALSGKYVVTPDELESDIRYLKANGYTFISAAELIDYAENGAALPEKCVMLTFDDGHYNFYGYVLPILEKNGAKAIVSVVGSYTDEYSESNIKNMSYGYLRWSEIYDLFLSSRVEVGNHSYDFHSGKNRNGAQRKKGESLSAYEAVFRADTEKAQNRFMTKTGFSPVIYTYPFGAYSEETTDWLKDMGFKISFSCTEGVNSITRNPDCLFLLKRFNRPSGVSSEKFFNKIINDNQSS